MVDRMWRGCEGRRVKGKRWKSGGRLIGEERRVEVGELDGEREREQEVGRRDAWRG